MKLLIALDWVFISWEGSAYSYSIYSAAAAGG